MTRINTRIIAPILTIALGALWIGIGIVDTGIWVDGRPTSGFFPSLAGALLVFVSVLAIRDELATDSPEFFGMHLYPVIAAVSVVLLALVIGFFPALALYAFLWLWKYEAYSLRFSLMVSAISIGAVYGIFRLWLRVPFPQGLIQRLVQG